jgi:hypothetical protein
MLDWLVEVTSAYKCSTRTYFMAVELFDDYLRGCKNQIVLEDKDIHLVGLASLFLASKYEDERPLSSKTLSQKISHRAFSVDDILKMHKHMIF